MQVIASIFRTRHPRHRGQNRGRTFAEHLGRAFGTETQGLGERPWPWAATGVSPGPGLVPLIRGIASTGLDVVDLGAGDRPMLYYVAATRGKHGCTSGIRVTGGPQPGTTTASRWCWGAAVYGDQIQVLMPPHRGRGTTPVARAASWDGHPGRVHPPHRVDCKALPPDEDRVVDGGNGIPGTRPRPSRALGCEVIDIYSEVDGDFPTTTRTRAARRTSADLKKIVHATGAELGPAFDGDGDRLGIVTATANDLCPDRQLMLLAADVLSRNRGARSSSTSSAASRSRLDPQARWQAADVDDRPPLVKAKLKETGSPFAGELSGHIFFGDAGTALTTPCTPPAACSKSCPAPPMATPCQALPNSFNTRAERALRRGRAPRGRGRLCQPLADFPGALELSPSTACASSTTTASASSALQHHAGAGAAL